MSVMSSSSSIKQLIPSEPANNSTFHGEPLKKNVIFSTPAPEKKSFTGRYAHRSLQPVTSCLAAVVQSTEAANLQEGIGGKPQTVWEME